MGWRLYGEVLVVLFCGKVSKQTIRTLKPHIQFYMRINELALRYDKISDIVHEYMGGLCALLNTCMRETRMTDICTAAKQAPCVYVSFVPKET